MYQENKRIAKSKYLEHFRMKESPSGLLTGAHKKPLYSQNTERFLVFNAISRITRKKMDIDLITSACFSSDFNAF